MFFCSNLNFKGSNEITTEIFKIHFEVDRVFIRCIFNIDHKRKISHIAKYVFIKENGISISCTVNKVV
jgi:hypothetical protein